MLVVYFDRQVIPGSSEYVLCHLVDHELGSFRSAINDDNGAPAYHPGALIKIILLAYSRGIIGSRRIESARSENILFIVVSGESGITALDHKMPP